MEPKRIIIEWAPGGEIKVTGPIGDKVLCFGMLEAAKDVVRTHVDKIGASPIVQATPEQSRLLS